MNVRQVTYNHNIMFIRSLTCFECPLNCDHFTIKEIFIEETPLSEDDQETQIPQQALKNKVPLKQPLSLLAEKMCISDSDEEWKLRFKSENQWTTKNEKEVYN